MGDRLSYWLPLLAQCRKWPRSVCGIQRVGPFPRVPSRVLTSYRGDAALITNSDLSKPDAPWAIQSVWSGGHTGIVRSILWDEDVGTRLLVFHVNHP